MKYEYLLHTWGGFYRKANILKIKTLIYPQTENLNT